MQLFDTYLSAGQPVLIAIRDVPPDENNPLSAMEIKKIWEIIYKDNLLVKIIVVPDILSVNYGRSVGYDVNEIEVPNYIANISATEIRLQILHGRSEWKLFVDEKIHELLENLLNSAFTIEKNK